MFAIGSYRLGLFRLLVAAFLFCGGIELLQVPLPTRHGRVSDFAVDLLGSYVAIGLVMFGLNFVRRLDAKKFSMFKRRYRVHGTLFAWLFG
jgi:VanZ family protein